MNENNQTYSWRDPKAIIALVGILLLAGVVAMSLMRDRFINPPYRQVTINGQGRVSYNPDLAIVTIGVQIDKAAKADEALSQLNAKMDSIIKAVKELEVIDSDIQTQNYSLYPQYDYKDNITVVSGYNANQQLVIKVTDYENNPERLNKIIAAASKAGANQIAGVTFDSSNLDELKQEARLEALKDAKEKSGPLAEAAGVELKEITSWWENYVQPSMYASYNEYGKGGMGAGGAIDPQIGAGSREVVVEVGVTYNIK